MMGHSIPRRFSLLGFEYTVSIISTSEWPAENAGDVGTCDSRTCEIAILEGPVQAMVQTFWHEAGHAMMRTMGRDSLHDDEAFVDLLGSMIHQIIATAQE